MKIAAVAIDGLIGSADRLYSYIVPNELFSVAVAGSRVTVPFGKGNKTRQGMIFSVFEGDGENFKSLISVTDKIPVLTDEMLKLSEYLHSCIFCSYFDVVHSVLPVGLNYKLKDFYLKNENFTQLESLSAIEREIFEFLNPECEISLQKIFERFGEVKIPLLKLCEKQAIFHNTKPFRKANDLKRRWVRIKDDAFDFGKLTARQSEIADIVKEIGSVSIKELEYFTGVTLSVINALQKKGVLEIFEKQEFRIPFKSTSDLKKEIVLTDEQNNAFNGLLLDANSKTAKTSLLYGVTGSGKTQVFLKLVDEVIKRDKGVIILVPEISLTPQMIKIFSDRYGEKIAVLHSGLSLGQRMDEYTRIKNGMAKIAIGTRSAVFAPFDNLGLIIIDEEQESTYKSEKSPRFHARDVARFRCGYHKCLLCLASATPSLQTFAAAKQNKIGLYTLKNRYGNAKLPQVSVVDMRKELFEGNSSDISRELAERIEEQLSLNKQVIILLNRRGHNTYVSCHSCGHVFSCDECSISYTYHSANNRLMCHYCGKSIPVPDICPECGAKELYFSGVGTQKLEEQLHLLFKKAKILRMDADSTMTRDSYSEKLNAFANGEYDIMVGTQMVAKGLDFPNVTLVGVIGADSALMSDDYRGFEKIYSLLTQVVGRAGRSDQSGVAVVQTNDPQNQIIEFAKNQNYDDFYNYEILNRKLMIFPPFCDLCMIFTQSSDSALAKSGINEVFENIKKNLKSDYSDVKIIILGPVAASVPRVNGKYRFRMLIKCKNNARFREMIENSVCIKRSRDLSVGIDINPETVI